MAEDRIPANQLTQATSIVLADEVLVIKGGELMRLTTQLLSDLKTWSNLSGIPLTFPSSPHGHAESEIVGLASDLGSKQPISEKNQALGYAGLDAAAKIFGAQQVYGVGINTACQGNDPRLSDARTSVPHAHPESDVTSLVADLLTKAPNASFRTILQAAGSHTAAKVAGTYALGMGDPLAVSGTGTLYPLATLNLVGADYPAVGALVSKLRLRVQLYTNDVAPTGNYTFGLYPITRPATSGGAGLNIFTLGTVVVGSTVLFTTPVADGLLAGVSAEFTLPTDGHYVIGVLTTATVAALSHIHAVAQLQMRNN